jgi:hypothetical protein
MAGIEEAFQQISRRLRHEVAFSSDAAGAKHSAASTSTRAQGPASEPQGSATETSQPAPCTGQQAT